MIYLPIVILAIVQGITEFLPISSSGHLVLTHHFLSDTASLSPLDQKRLDIAVHIGTLFAVIAYFYSDFIGLVMGGIDIFRFKIKTTRAKKTWMIVLASIPVMIVGTMLYSYNMAALDNLHNIAIATIFFAIVLYIADRLPEKNIIFGDMTWKHALFFGVMQCLALIPGTSRSGITMAAGRFIGYSRSEAARISLLMGMVTIAAAGTLAGFDVFHDQTVSQDLLTMMGIGIILSFIAAYIAIMVMMKWFDRSGTMTPFVIYRVVLGLALLGLLHFGVIAEKM